jgi:general secretion pathway protein G
MVNHLLTRNRRSSFRRTVERGFTLVEMLVVISIIALIMALVAPRVLNFLADSKVKAAKIQIQSLGSALDLYALDTGHYPSSSEGLDALMHRPSGEESWSGPYLKGNVVPNDPWGRPYIYRSPGDHGAYDIVSRGANGQEEDTGASASINSWSQ